MWPFYVLGLLAACLLGWAITWLLQGRRIKQLERTNEEIQVEETLVFDFLHGLGAAFTETIRPADLHRLIVEGAARILDANGGALYMIERGGTRLAAAFVSKGCPPLVEVPPEILQQSGGNPGVIENYLRTHTVAVGEGVIGRAWESGHAAFLADLCPAPELGIGPPKALAPSSLMVTPLLYGKQNMGVLALA